MEADFERTMDNILSHYEGDRDELINICRKSRSISVICRKKRCGK